jgi:hypothetical protein
MKQRLKLEELENSLKDNEMPLDMMLRVMRNREEPMSTRFAAAKAAAPYCHPQLQAIAVRNLGQDGKLIVVNLTIMQLPEPTSDFS